MKLKITCFDSDDSIAWERTVEVTKSDDKRANRIVELSAPDCQHYRIELADDEAERRISSKAKPKKSIRMTIRKTSKKRPEKG